ncbi:hypothetical protein P280DRAFT_451692 [Massarina eburnea CBS 473.64]|uniref:Uncharacterized protein n=1 Tax=Massarina eburnea CBS 473.64 TaxID=1395130 RepID=A0A6A6RZJ6_9PLEO|nr:hypothetical protein P280DRAFT_451692 [Massarina eburnea CBS 473.64]
MAATLKRRRAAVSYREPSSDVDGLESDSEPSTRTLHTAPVRRSTRYRSPSPVADPPFPATHSENAPPKANTARTSRRNAQRKEKRQVSYKDASSDGDWGDDDFELEETIEQARPPKRVAASTRTQKSSKSGKSTRMTLGAPLKPRAAEQPSSNTMKIPTDGHKPAWYSLPYHVLLEVFMYASHPLHDENMAPSKSIAWLLQVARVCSAFTRPALTVLYRTPPIYAMRQPQRGELVQHLINPPANAYANYQVMAKRLELDATKMSSSTDPLYDAANLSALIAALTTLKEIDIFDPLDRPPYRPRLTRVRRWNYPDELFAALQQSTLLIKSWRWNSLFCAHGPLWVKEIHGNRAFQGLRELTLTKFETDEKRKADDQSPTTEELLGSALAVLPNLESLTFESCKVVNGRLLPLLPSTLVHLEITNCINVFSDDLHAFLFDRGRHLEEIVLNHNQCLNISFLVDLKVSCPRLEVLRMDLNYYSSLVMSSDNEPLYDWLLGLDEIPTWPSTLRVIDMEYLRHWGDSTAATNFFVSLVDAAEELPNLRELRISAMVDLGWRQRANYRRKWESRLEHVFASRSPAPSPHLASQRAFREWKSSQGNGTEKNDSLLDMTEEVSTKENGMKQDGSLESDSDALLLPQHGQKHGDRWSSKRLRTRGRTCANYDESSGSDAGADDDANDEGEAKYVQGMCHTVVFRIDNSRPREAVFTEADFQDAEKSGDEDWDGNDVVDEGYAW